MLTVPAVVSGRLDAERDGDFYEREVAEAGSHAIDVYCERIGSRADPYVAVLDDKGDRVAELDDYGHRINAFDGHLLDPSGQATLAAGRKCRLLVQNRYPRGGARYQYVLTVSRPRPDFFAAGKACAVKLVLDRLWTDAKAAVAVQPLGFPGGFKLGNQEFKPDAAELEATLEVAANTRPGDYTLVLLCQSQVPLAKDAAAATKPNTLMALPSLPLRLKVTPPPKP